MKCRVFDIVPKISKYTVIDFLKEKHPHIINQEYILQNDENTLPYHPMFFNKIDASVIKRNKLNTHGIGC